MLCHTATRLSVFASCCLSRLPSGSLFTAASGARPAGNENLTKGFFTGIVIISMLIGPATVSAATVYVYKDARGSTVISDRASSDKSLKLIKTYTPRASVRALGAGSRSYTRRSLNPRSTEYDRMIYQLADQYKLDRALVKAIIQIESSFNPQALSPKGAQGLMQLMPATASRYNVLDPYDAQQNLRGGMQFFADLMKRYQNDIRLALAAYNAGAGAVSKYQGIPPFPETQAYVTQVMQLHRNYQRLTGIYAEVS